jgi:hypothetical protein
LSIHGFKVAGPAPRGSLGVLHAVVLLALATSGFAAVPVPTPIRRSQQFTVVDARSTYARSPGQLRSSSGEELVRLDADTLLLSAERIKDTLLRELNTPSDRGGRIELRLYLAAHADDRVGVVSSVSPEGWDYVVEFPDQIEGQTLIRAVSQVVLLEFANRGQGPKSADLPLWLVEGVTAHLTAVGGPDLVMGSVPVGKMFRVVRERRGLDYLSDARQVLRSNTPPSFQELAYPKIETLAGVRLRTYQAAAHLFFYELLHSQNGATHLLTMLRELPRCWNWEMALLRSFPTEFHRMLDVEKRWAVDVLAFTARDETQVWSTVMALDRFDELLAVPAQVHVDSDSLPQRQTVTLQQVISRWDLREQSKVIRQKLVGLQAARFSSPPALVVLIDGYFHTLATYLQRRDLADRDPETRMQPTLNASLVAQDAIRELDLLDKRRDALRPENRLSAKSL